MTNANTKASAEAKVVNVKVKANMEAKMAWRALMKALVNKARSIAGESFVESLASLLIAALAVIMLAGAIVTASQLNRRADDTTALAAQLPSNYKPEQASVTFTYGGADDATGAGAGGTGAGGMTGGEGASGGGTSGATGAPINVDLYNAYGLYYYELPSEGTGA